MNIPGICSAHPKAQAGPLQCQIPVWSGGDVRQEPIAASIQEPGAIPALASLTANHDLESQNEGQTATVAAGQIARQGTRSSQIRRTEFGELRWEFT